ncbi:MAG: hypothetical protein MJA31_06920 [Clostridia bacterium]|nr:hypothetical protein [Clostridia bacterium]
MKQFKLFINNEWVDASNGETFTSYKEIDIISFTGSESVGRRLIELSSQSQRIKKTC